MHAVETRTLTVATISLNAGGVSATGQVQTDGSIYWAVVNGTMLKDAGKFDPAVEHLSNALAKIVRGRGPGWGLHVQCHRADWGVVFGNLARGGGGGGGLPPCVDKAMGAGPFTRVEDALHAATRALRRCCA